MRIKILSSIPGRIRIRVDGLVHNENAVYYFKESLQFYQGIILVSPNSVSGNMLVYYDDKLVDSRDFLERITSSNIDNLYPYVHKERAKKLCIFRSYTPKNFANKYPVKVYYNEFALSKRLLTLSVIMSSLALCFSFDLNIVLSIIFLGFPGLLFFIRRSTYRIAQKNLNYRKFDFMDPNLIYELSVTEHLLIEDSILNFQNHMDRPKDLTSFPCDDVLYLIRNFRNLGIVDISMISRKKHPISSWFSYMLGINNIELDRNVSYDRSIYNRDKTTLILTSSDLISLHKEQIVVFLGYNKLKPETDAFVITFRLDLVHKIPSLIETSKYCNELAIRSGNVAVTINIIGIFLGVANFITPLSSIALYFFNYLGNMIYINTKLSQHEKEYSNEIQRSKYSITR